MIATTKIQSQYLASILDHSTADCCWVTDRNGEHLVADTLSNIQERLDKVYDEQGVTEDNWASLLPAWSLDALLEVMPKDIKKISLIRLDKPHFNLKHLTWECGFEDVGCTGVSPLTATYEMVCWLLQQGYIKTEKK